MVAKYWIKSTAVALGLVTILFSGTTVSAKQAAAPAAAPPAQAADAFPEFPAGPGRDVFLKRCSACHTPKNVLAQGRDKDGWTDIITKMVGYGAQGSDDEFGQILDYLTKNFPPTPAKPSINSFGASLTVREAMEISAPDLLVNSAR